MKNIKTLKLLELSKFWQIELKDTINPLQLFIFANVIVFSFYVIRTAVVGKL